jgi:hypothetical protein
MAGDDTRIDLCSEMAGADEPVQLSIVKIEEALGIPIGIALKTRGTQNRIGIGYGYGRAGDPHHHPLVAGQIFGFPKGYERTRGIAFQERRPPVQALGARQLWSGTADLGYSLKLIDCVLFHGGLLFGK